MSSSPFAVCSSDVTRYYIAFACNVADFAALAGVNRSFRALLRDDMKNMHKGWTRMSVSIHHAKRRERRDIAQWDATQGVDYDDYNELLRFNDLDAFRTPAGYILITCGHVRASAVIREDKLCRRDADAIFYSEIARHALSILRLLKTKTITMRLLYYSRTFRRALRFAQTFPEVCNGSSSIRPEDETHRNLLKESMPLNPYRSPIPPEFRVCCEVSPRMRFMHERDHLREEEEREDELAYVCGLSLNPTKKECEYWRQLLQRLQQNDDRDIIFTLTCPWIAPFVPTSYADADDYESETEDVKDELDQFPPGEDEE